MMNLVLAPNVMLETPVQHYPQQLHPAPIALDMIDVMNKHGGIGISANQVAFDGRIFVMKPQLNKKYGDYTVVINPVIRGLSEEREYGEEGCLSHPGLVLKVKRPVSCMVDFQTLTSDMKNVITVSEKYDGIDARVFLHEYDHLFGIQYINRVSKLKYDMAEKKRIKRIKNGRTK